MQPGEEFILKISSSAFMWVDDTPPGGDAYAAAEIEDPFELSATPPPAISINGLVLPGVPEPSVAALLLLGAAFCGRRTPAPR